MHTTDKNKIIAESYYKAMGRKDLAELEQYLHPDVTFIAPLSQTKGKEALLQSIEKFFTLFESLTIQSQFSEKDQAMIVYDLVCPQPIGHARSAALLTFTEELIISVELFYDARPFVR